MARLVGMRSRASEGLAHKTRDAHLHHCFTRIWLKLSATHPPFSKPTIASPLCKEPYLDPDDRGRMVCQVSCQHLECRANWAL
jgi:hypothetical protein